MQRVADVFAIWPTDAGLAREIGAPYSTVSAWKQRGSIPVAYWRAIIDAAHRRGHPEITADLLVGLHADLSGEQRAGFFEDEVAYRARPETDGGRGVDQSGSCGKGHFSRYRHLRRDHFKTADEIEEHIRALREEWSHR